MKVNATDCLYRGFRIGIAVGLHGYLAAWRSSLETEWNIGHIYVDTILEVLELAKECIDFQFLRETREVELGRRLTLNELVEMRPK